jgi:cell division protein FtsL
MKRPALFIIFILTIIIGLSIAQIGIANQVSTAGSELASLQNNVSDLKRENAVLQEQILTTASLTNISEKAARMGFVLKKAEVYLNTSTSLAMRQ